MVHWHTPAPCRACLPCGHGPAPRVLSVCKRSVRAPWRSCGTAWRACEHGAPPDLRAWDETVLIFVDTDEDLYEMMELALEVRLGARHVHARVAQRRREGRHLREVAVGQVGVVLCEAAGGGACRLRPVDGRYVLAKQQLWLAVVPASSRVPRARHAPASSGAFKQGLFGSRHFVTQPQRPVPSPPPLSAPRPPPHPGLRLFLHAFFL